MSSELKVALIYAAKMSLTAYLIVWAALRFQQGDWVIATADVFAALMCLTWAVTDVLRALLGDES